MNIDIPELNEITERLDRIDRRLDALVQLEVANEDGIPAWCTLRKCADLKGIPYNTLLDRPKLQPPKDEVQFAGGRRTRKWPRAVVIVWLAKTDEELGYTGKR